MQGWYMMWWTLKNIFALRFNINNQLWELVSPSHTMRRGPNWQHWEENKLLVEERAGRLPKIGIGSHQWHLLDDTSGGAHRWEFISDIFWELLDEKSSVDFPHQASEMHLLLQLKSSPQSHPIKILSLATATSLRLTSAVISDTSSTRSHY